VWESHVSCLAEGGEAFQIVGVEHEDSNPSETCQLFGQNTGDWRLGPVIHGPTRKVLS